MTARILCFGELLLRLGAPAREPLLQTPHFDVHVGGAEANVAVSLACLGHDAAVVSAAPDNALGEAAVREVRRYGVEVGGVARRPGRMGLYFLTQGALHRPAEVLYDRAGSSFAGTADYDWPRLLDGAAWLHLSGVSPALGVVTAEACLDAARTARRLGVKVSFDGNFRSKLWQAWNGDAASILRRLFAEADLLLADHRDIAVVLGDDASASTVDDPAAVAARRAFDAFPNLQHMAWTTREQSSADVHALSARFAQRDGSLHQAPTYTLDGVVDRIGGGDAFAAGILHGLVEGMAPQATLHFGLAAACLKHSFAGDFNLATRAMVEDLVADRGFHVRR